MTTARSPRTRFALLVLPVTLTLLLTHTPILAIPAEEPIDPLDAWRTVAEATEFRATSSYDETIALARRLADRSPEMRLDYFGTSAQGRPMPVVIVSSDRAFTPAAAARTGKAVVMIQSGIHAGEIDGKVASMMMLREIAFGHHRDILDGAILLVVPIYNVDGHERVSPFNRPNQDGPVDGMGFRTTADGHDLNRDHVKLDTPEARALVDLFNRWQPHLHVDNHVTDGVDHDWVLTYSWAEAPQAAAPIDAWLSDHMPPVIRAMSDDGFRVGPYVALLDDTDPTKGFSSYAGQTALSTGYFALRRRPSILVENHASKPFPDRVRANRAFMVALLREIAGHAESLRDAVVAAERQIVALGRPGAAPSSIVLKYEAVDTGETIRFPVYEWESVPSVALGEPILQYRAGVVREVDVPWIHLAEPVETVARPRGYLVLSGWPVIERRLKDHGVVTRRLTDARELQVETLRVSNPRRVERRGLTYQGRSMLDVDVTATRARRTVPAGTLWVPADQPAFDLAAQILEPDASGSLVRWGMLSIVFERKEHIDRRVLERHVRQLLTDDSIAAEWQRALVDPAFAANPDARWLWWYQRTEFWDDTVGRMPVMRALEPLPGPS